jgi:hypothetical protein
MTKPTVNLRDHIVFVADGSSCFSMLVQGMLRGVGRARPIEARNAVEACVSSPANTSTCYRRPQRPAA